MTTQKRSGPDELATLSNSLLEATKKTCELLKPNSLGIYVRKPLLDEDCPEASDVDLISIYEKPEELPERITVQSKSGLIFVDILWIPISKIFDASEAATYKILPHLLLEYKDIWLKSDTVRSIIENVKGHVFDREPWERRLNHQIGFGDAALEEAKKNLSYPPVVLFFLQTAHAYYMMALADSLKLSTMSLLTRPMNKLKQMAAETNLDLEKLICANLSLDKNPSRSISALRRIHNRVVAKCAERHLQGTTMRTLGHYAYTISPQEFEYRQMVAKALTKHKDSENANFYLRFWAYSLSRCPVVLEEARQGRKPSFYVPFEPYKESVLATCPEILDDVETIFGGKITASEAEQAIRGTLLFKNLIVNQIRLGWLKKS